MSGAGDGALAVRVPVRVDLAGGWSDVHHFAAREGGAVLNAAIDRYVEGSARWEGGRLRVAYELALPPGTHLGTSASIDVAWLALANGLLGREQSPVELAEAAYQLERLLGVEGGKQDQYAAALGGFNLLRFGGEDEPVGVEPVAVPPATIAALADRCVLCHAGRGQPSGAVHDLVWARYRRGDDEVVAALRELRDSALRGRDALLAGDLDGLARVLAVNREAIRRLHPAIITPRMDELFAAAEVAGALGSKPCGAGGGGCLLFICAEGARPGVEAALRAQGSELIPFGFAPRAGLEWAGAG